MQNFQASNDAKKSCSSSFLHNTTLDRNLKVSWFYPAWRLLCCTGKASFPHSYSAGFYWFHGRKCVPLCCIPQLHTAVITFLLLWLVNRMIQPSQTAWSARLPAVMWEPVHQKTFHPLMIADRAQVQNLLKVQEAEKVLSRHKHHQSVQMLDQQSSEWCWTCFSSLFTS